jgi:nitrite reductase/ring-hydroxylating ferredoxin subunit
VRKEAGVFAIPDDILDPEGSLFRVEHPDHGAVAIAIVEGRAYRFQDTCTHQQCSLSEGFLDEFAVICPCHQSVFDVRTGEVLVGPATTPLRTFACGQLESSTGVTGAHGLQQGS